MNRRRFMAGAGTAAVAALAGCSSGEQVDASEASNTFPIREAKLDGDTVVLRVTRTQNADDSSYRPADMAYLVGPDGAIDETKERVLRQLPLPTQPLARLR